MYQSWSVVFGEQPSSVKWNLLGSNDAFFNTQVGDNFSSGTTSKVGYEVIGRSDALGAPATTMTATGIPARKHLRVLISAVDSGGVLGLRMRFNNDSANNYSLRSSDNGAADGTFPSQPEITVGPESSACPHFAVVDIMNAQSEEKLVVSHCTFRGTAGAANLPGRRVSQSKWVNTSAQISRIDIVSPNNYAISSGFIVEGRD